MTRLYLEGVSVLEIGEVICFSLFHSFVHRYSSSSACSLVFLCLFSLFSFFPHSDPFLFFVPSFFPFFLSLLSPLIFFLFFFSSSSLPPPFSSLSPSFCGPPSFFDLSLFFDFHHLVFYSCVSFLNRANSGRQAPLSEAAYSHPTDRLQWLSTTSSNW
jgi:hypothetical protein